MNTRIISLQLIALLCVVSSFGQTKIASRPVNLLRPAYSQQLFHAVNTQTDEVFALVADKATLTVLKLNSALFIIDEYKTERPDKNLFMVGYDFTPQGLPVVYWGNADFEEITAIQYDLSTKKQRALPGVEGSDGDRNVTSFNTADAFYILSFDDSNDNNLTLRKYDDGKYSRHALNFSGQGIKKENGQTVKIRSLLEGRQVEYLDSREWQPLYRVSQPLKLYAGDQTAIMTLDHSNNETLVVEIDLNNFQVSSRSFPLADERSVHTNSYLSQGKLYQVSSAKERLQLEVRDFASGELLSSHIATASDTISFRTSPLYSQTGGKPAQQFKSSRKFLSKLYSASPGVSVYPMGGHNFLTVGGVRSSVNAANVAFGVSLGVGVILSGGSSDIYFGDLFGESGDVQNIYFEAMFDQNAQPGGTLPTPLYVDHLSGFMSQNDHVTILQSFSYKDYFLLGYIDPRTDEYILRKFENGYYEPFSASGDE